jgi:hypothetical protein
MTVVSRSGSPNEKMQHELDNTMETLLRRAATARGDEPQVSSGAAFEHLEPEDFAAFAENVLPPVARARFASHLADCGDCRQVLTNFALIQEAEERAIGASETAILLEKTATAKADNRNGWLRNLFALPNLGYAAAALAIVFIGVFSFVAFRSTQQKEAAQVVFVAPEQIEEEERERRKRSAPQTVAPPSTPEPTPEATPEITPEMMLAENTNQAAENESPKTLPPSYRDRVAEQSNARRDAEVAREAARESNQSNKPVASNTTTVASASPTPAAAASSNKPAQTGANNQDRAKTEIARASGDESNEATKQQADASALEQTDVQRQSSRAAPAVAAPKPLPTQTVGGKTFRKNLAAWIDVSYSGQSATEVRRGSDDYKKLDAGLRSIAEQLGGEVLVIWRGKAYRIR